LKFFLAILFIGFGILGVSYLQSRFDHGDAKKALAAIAAKFPEAQGCQAEMISRFQGRVRVQCHEKAWIVDVVRGTLREDD